MNLGLQNEVSAVLPSQKTLEQFFDRLWPICRSITGNGLRESLKILQEIVPLEKIEVPSGTEVYDWVVPKEWNISDAYIEDPQGNKIVDFKECNLHVLGYSVPVDTYLELNDLLGYLHSLPDQPDAVPYLTSYYKERWGFCISHKQKLGLKPGRYHVAIKSSLKEGSLSYGHAFLKAHRNTEDEFLISTYLCHPSLANNELSGPLVAAFLYQALSRLPDRKMNYRFYFGPETIGTICFLNTWGQRLKKFCKGGFVVTCCGDDRNITYKKTRQETALIDKVTLNLLKHLGKPFKVVEFFPPGSDERQYGSPGFNLPVASLMRTMYTEYPEYHTSLDNKDVISFLALRESIEIYLKALLSFELSTRYKTTVMCCEPKLDKRGLYPSLGSLKELDQWLSRMMYLINYSDGDHDVCDIAEKAQCSVLDMAPILQKLLEKELLVEMG